MNRACEDIRELLPLLADGGLGPADDRRVREHLEGCAACRREAASWAALDRLLAEELPREQVVSTAELEGVLARVHATRPAWQVAPTPVRFWRSWASAGALGLAAALVALVGLYSPWAHLTGASAAVRDEVASVVPQTPDLAAVRQDVSGLPAAARAWPSKLRQEAVERWDQGAALAQTVLSRVGAAPFVIAILLALGANLAYARGAVAPRRRLQEGV